MKKNWAYMMSLSVALVVAACSSSEKSEDDPQFQDVPEVVDAGTDAVPQGTAEQPGALPPSTEVAASEGQPAVSAAASSPTETVAAAGSAEAPAESAPKASHAEHPASGGGHDTYTVQSGQTLMQIAFDLYGDLYRWRELYETNRSAIADPNHIPAGTVLSYEKSSVPVQVTRNGEKYLIKTGDTLGSISGDVYGTRRKWRVLWENNKQLIRDPNQIFAGFYLYYQKELANPAMAKAQPAGGQETTDRAVAGTADGEAGGSTAEN